MKETVSKTSTGICVAKEISEGVTIYKTTCGCLEDRHTHTLSLDLDDRDFGGTVSLTLYAEVRYNDGWGHYFGYKIWGRIKGAIKLLLTGDISMTESFFFIGEDHIRDYIRALQEGLSKLKGCQNPKGSVKKLKEKEC